MPRIKKMTAVAQRTPVDDVRIVRERLSREAGGDIHLLIQRSREAAEKFRGKLGLKTILSERRPVRSPPSRRGKHVNPSPVRSRSDTTHTKG